jgi:hypothetical protein
MQSSNIKPLAIGNPQCEMQRSFFAHLVSARQRQNDIKQSRWKDAATLVIATFLCITAANAIGYAEHRSRSHDAVIRVYDQAGNVIQKHEQKGHFEQP